MKVGGRIERLITPETEERLVDVFRDVLAKGDPWHILGRGSNTIFHDGDLPGTVIHTTLACRRLDVVAGSGCWFSRRLRVYAGVSVTLQKLIRFCLEHRVEAPSYLNSVPGNVGGAIFMNAGLGVREGKSLADFITRVRVCDGDQVRWLDREACGFCFRRSVFFDRPWLILGAEFEFGHRRRGRTRREVRERMKRVALTQDLTYPSAGSVFSSGYEHFPELVGYRIGGAAFSDKTPNWIVNLGGATCADVLALVDAAIQRHRRAGCADPVLEIRVF